MIINRLVRLGAFCAVAASALLCAPADAQTASPPQPKLQPAMAKIRATGSVAIAHRPDAFPIGYLDANKQPTGYGIDVCRDIVRLMERDLKKPLRIVWVPVTARTRVEVINSGQADLECGNTINDPQRRKTSGYSIPYLFTGPRLLVRADSTIRSAFDLGGKKIGAVTGTNAIPLLQARIKAGTANGMTIVEYKGYEEGAAAVERGEIDGFATIDLLLAGLRAKSKHPEALKITGSYLALEAVAILLRKEDVEFKKVVDRHLAALMLDGTVARYYDKWFLRPIAPDNLRLDLPMNPVLRDQLSWPSDRTGDEFTL
jgi:glutamate/aspartate transport system substrate-binding protein